MTEVTDAAIAAALAKRAELLADRPTPTRLSDESLVRQMIEASLPHLLAMEVRRQAHRYMQAIHGKDYVFRAPETFGNVLEQWIWSVASGVEETLGEKCIAAIEERMKARRATT